MIMLEEEIEKISRPQIKFSSNLLNKKYKLKFLVKSKKYGVAKELQEDIRMQEEIESINSDEKFIQSIQKLRDNKKKKHMGEYEAVKARLEKSINSKLKQRMTEYEQLLLRIQNCHNDMMNKQSVEFGKIQAVHAKLLSKYSLNIDDIANRYEQIQEEDPDMIHEEEEYEQKENSRENYVEAQKGNFSKHLESSSQGDMKIVEENSEEESSLTNARHFNKKEGAQLKTQHEGMKTQGQINGYWKKDHIEDFKDRKLSGEPATNHLEQTLEQTNGFNNFQKIESNQENSDRESNASDNSESDSDNGSRSSDSSNSRRSSSRSSSNDSSSGSDSD